MSYVTVLWSVAGAAAFLLGVVHILVWIHDRQARANLSFAFVAWAVLGIAVAELGMMQASTPEEWGAWVRWCHVPVFIVFCGTLLFVRWYFDAGRWWLLWTVVVARALILVWNFSTYPNFNFEQIVSIDRVSFLGQQVAVIGAATPNPWQWLATATGALSMLFVADASATLWRTRPAARRKAVVVGGGVLAFVAIAVVYTQLVIWGVVHWPMTITLAFTVMLAAMAFELSHDFLAATRLARDLRESERRLELAANAARLGLWTWDSRRGQIWATDRARAMFGLSSTESVDVAQVFSRIHAEDALRLKDFVQQALVDGGEYTVHFRVRVPNESPRWIAAQGRSEPASAGEPMLLRGVLSDVTDQKQIQDEADELRRELAHAGRVTMLGQLASALAHELKQPLSAILRNTEAARLLLERTPLDVEELRAIIIDIHADDRRASDVIDRLRTLLRRRQMEFQPIAVGSLLQDVSALVRFDAAARHVMLECSVGSALPPVWGDRVHLSQVLINLIMNGMDATTESANSRRHVIVEASARQDRSIEVAVTDSGPGIAPEHIGRIFEPFFTTKAGGMGMGLCVSRTIIEAHGGRLWAENNADRGATFRFALPAAQGGLA